MAVRREKNENLELLSNEARDKLLASIEEINKLTNKSQLSAERLGTIDRDYVRIEDEIDITERKKQKIPV